MARGLALVGAAGLAAAALRGALDAAAFAGAARPRGAEHRTHLRASRLPEALQERLPTSASAAHRARREKAAGAATSSRPARSHGNAKVRLNNLVSKTVRRSLLAGDILYSASQEADGGFVVSVRIAALEEGGEELSFSGLAPDRLSAERSAAEAALQALPPAPDFEPRYPRPEVAAAWVAEQLEVGDAPVEIDSTMADVLPTLAHLPEALSASARYVLENEDPCRVSIQRDPEHDASFQGTVRTMQVSGRTQAGKLAAAMRVRLLGEEGEQRHDALELRFAGKSASKEAAIAVKILQRFFPSSAARGSPRFRARFQHFEGYRKQGLVVSVAA